MQAVLRLPYAEFEQCRQSIILDGGFRAQEWQLAKFMCRLAAHFGISSSPDDYVFKHPDELAPVDEAAHEQCQLNLLKARGEAADRKKFENMGAGG